MQEPDSPALPDDAGPSANADRAVMIRWLAYLYLAAGVLGLLNAVVPEPEYNVPVLLALSAVAFAMAAALLLHRGRLPGWSVGLSLAAGTILVCPTITFTEGVPNTATLLYLWIALYSFYFFAPRAAALQMLLICASYSAAIALSPPPFPAVPHAVTTLGTIAIAAILVGALKGRLDGTIAELRSAMRERDQALGRLEATARTDHLTGLPNRRAWQQRFVEEFRRAARTESPLSVVLLDLDGFKALNDSEGHQAGDRLLRQSAAGWQGSLRETDFVARLGGDEFGALLAGCSAGGAELTLERMRAAAPEARYSAGVVVWDGEEPAGTLLARADAALYAAKQAGGNRISVAA